MRNCVFLLTFLTLPTTLLASEKYEFYNGIRSLSMGGVNAAVVNDETALISNPAGLGKVRSFYGTIFDPEIHGSSNVANMYLNQSFTNPFDLSQVREVTAATPEKHFHFLGQIMPSIVVKNFGLGVYAKYSMDAEMNADATSMQTDYTNDTAALLGYNFRFFDGRIKLGFVGKYINRVEIHKAIDPTGPMTIKDHASSGTGLATDVGLVLTAPWTLLPSLAVVVHDVGGTKFDQGPGTYSTATQPAELKQDADVGFSVSPIHTNYIRSVWSVEYKGALTKEEETDSAKRVHAGVEFNFYDLIFLRAGMNQRYWTGGLELATEHMQFQIGTYGEEIGTADQPKEDRRVMGKFSFRF